MQFSENSQYEEAPLQPGDAVLDAQMLQQVSQSTLLMIAWQY
jgi:hypothetical protein